jgi:hypothetical protein
MIVNVPDGIELDSYVNLLQYLRGRRASPFKRRCLIWRANRVSESMLSGRINPLQILVSHSVWPLVVATLCESTNHSVTPEMASTYVDDDFSERVMRLMPKRAPSYRHCPRCISEDLKEYGFAFGRSLHQLTVVRTCPRHDVVLEEECAKCQADFESPIRYAPYRGELQLCRQCGSTKGRPVAHTPSDGYRALVELLGCGMEGRAPEVGPRMLKAALDRFAELTLEHDVDLFSMFSKFWANKDLRGACEVSSANPQEIRAALLFGTPPKRVLSAYVLASFFHTVIVKADSLPIGPAVRTPSWNFKTNFLVHPIIKCRARDFGIPMRIIYWVFLGDWSAIRKFGYSNKELRRFVATLESLEQLAIHARRAIFLRERLLKLNFNGGKIARPPGILVRSAENCLVTERFKFVCKLLGLHCEMVVLDEVRSESPEVLIDGVEMRYERPYDFYTYVIQRAQSWPQLRGVKFLLIPNVPSFHNDP